MQASERRFTSVGLVLCASLFASACSLFVDFDRGKIHETGGKPNGDGGRAGGGTSSGGRGGSGGGSGDGGGGGSGGVSNVDGGMGGSVDAGRGGAGGTPVDSGTDHSAPPSCDVKTHEGCGMDELCCPSAMGPRCEKTSADECEVCGKPCPSTLAKSCESRTCVCEPSTNRACTGTGPERLCVQSGTADPHCVECTEATDCATRTDGKHECVTGKCVQCDPDPAKGSSGCGGNTPICDAATMACKACSPTAKDCGGTLVCTAAGACGGCNTSSTDCATPTTPICDIGTTECRGCTTNTECTAERSLPFCIDTSRCSPCQPTTEQGCTDPTKPDCRPAADGNYACQACLSDDNCKNVTGAPVCDTASGKCVECSADNDCTTNSKKPLCVGNVCVACDTASIAATADQRCLSKPGGAVVCVQSGTQKGQCGACDPADSGGCSDSQLCCEQSGIATCAAVSPTQCTACGVACNATLSNGCADRGCQCGASAPCTGTGKSRFCLGSPGACVECKADADCTDPTAPLCESNQCVGCDAATGAAARCAAKTAGTPECASVGARKGRCATCDPGDGSGCTGTNQCDGATATCVDCVNDSGCTGMNDKCDTTAQKCVDCTDTGGCGDVPKTPICDANTCRACASDAECKSASGTAGPLCGTNGSCVADTVCATAGDCTDGIHAVCVDIGNGAADQRCRVCDPATNGGCATGTCSPGFTCGP